MKAIDNGDLTIENIPFKIQMIIELIKQLKKNERMISQMTKKEME